MADLLERQIPFSRPYLPARSRACLDETLASGQLGGDGPHGAWCESFIAGRIAAHQVLLTNSASTALDLACRLAALGPGDEVVMPSFTFASTASAVVKTGATPVFVDIDPETLDLDVAACDAAVTDRTRAVVAVHYAGQSRDIGRLRALADARGLRLIEDAAQAFDSRLGGRALGTFGALAAFSFQQGKNLAVGEGGALVVNEPLLAGRARHLRDKGTNRRAMLDGDRPFYSWVDVGAGSHLPEPLAALLRGQLEEVDRIAAARRCLWRRYDRTLGAMELPFATGSAKIADEPGSNHHAFHLLCPDQGIRDRLIMHLGARGITAAFHFVPLHSSPAGRRYGRTAGPLPVTDRVSATLLRLPLFVGLGDGDVDRVCAEVARFFGG